MNSYKNIHTKLQKFIKKYYLNELIKGSILFFSLGFLYFIFTIFIEYFLWLKPQWRTLLFWIFIVVEVILFSLFIVFPILKLYGLKKGISKDNAAKIIGEYFPEISDKLLNIIQLKTLNQSNELIEASIAQKAKLLSPFKFRKAVKFTSNKKYIKFTFIPLFIVLIIYLSGFVNVFNNSVNRVVHYTKAYTPPAPFTFKVLNNSLNVIEDESLTISIETEGNTVPENAKIFFSNESYYLENKDFGKFEFFFPSVKNSFSFYLESDGIISKQYTVTTIPTPVIASLKMVLKYPKYTEKRNEVIQHTGNAIVPQGTVISWQIETHQADKIIFLSAKDSIISFSKNTKDYYSYTRQLMESMNYTIATSNQFLANHERLNFNLEVIRDEYPKIAVNSDIDSITRGPAEFVGELSDDYGVEKLQLIYYNKNNPKLLNTHEIAIAKSSLTDFYYSFPEGVSLEEGVDYEMYFEVFDNDAINGSKKSKSKTFSYYIQTKKELRDELLNEQKESINNLFKSVKQNKQEKVALEKFKNELQKKASTNWNDTKKLEQFIQRQTQYQEMFQKQTNQLQKNLNEQPKIDLLKDKKKDLQQRIEESKKLAEQEKILEELKELTEKLEKEDFIDKLKKLTKKNSQNEQRLERLLELTKRFYVEQKAVQIKEKLNELSKKQKEVAKENEIDNSKKQQEINKDFKDIKKDLNELKQQNNDLMRPMKFPTTKDEIKDIDNELNNALDNLKNQQTKQAQKNQKSASKKMKQLSDAMEQSMMTMEGEQIDENIEDLRKIVENLIEFSFQQEDLLNKFSGVNNAHPEYSNNIRQQHLLKEYFNHIDDSLYVLSLRLVKMGSNIQKEVSDAHYYLDESLVNFTDNKFNLGISNQQFVITAANNLANSLSDLLESLLNASPSFGKGKGKSQEFGLPDVIKKQSELMEQLKEGIEKGKGKGEGGEKMNSELYDMYKQQTKLKQVLDDILGNNANENSNKKDGDVVKKMEELENELLEKGFSKELLQRMQQLNYELLKLEKATLQQGTDKIRKAETNTSVFEKKSIDKIKLKNQYFNKNEILNRQSLPLRSIYKKKVQTYFKTVEEEQ